MKRELTCILCPRGCLLTADDTGGDLKISGNTCLRGKKYGLEECTHPVRTLTSLVRVSDREDTMLSVKTEEPIPKSEIFSAMERIRAMTVCTPVEIGDVLEPDFFGTRLVATKQIL